MTPEGRGQKVGSMSAPIRLMTPGVDSAIGSFRGVYLKSMPSQDLDVVCLSIQVFVSGAV